MKKKFIESIAIPEGVIFEYKSNILKTQKGDQIIKRKLDIPNIKINLEEKSIFLESSSGSRNEFKNIKTTIAHIKNMISGLENPFVYELEACNVHFPMTLKTDGEFLIINNFLGEKVPRRAKLMKEVDLTIKGSKITISSLNREAAGQTAANIEKSTKIKNRDRRVFQDGIYIVNRPGGKK